MSEPSDVEVELDLDMTLLRIERVMGGMPFGGTYFRHAAGAAPAMGNKPSPLERLLRIEGNLTDLRDGLANHALHHQQLVSDRDELTSDLAALGRLLKRVTDAGA